MNKKFLSAILFGALMVTSTGTFVSCKDYDEDIDAINSELTNIKSQIAALQSKVDAGNYVTGVTKTADGITFAFSNGSPVVVAIKDGAQGPAGKDGSVVEVKEGVLYIDGEATEIKVCEAAAEFKPAVSVVEGEWAVLNEEGEYVSTGILATSTTAVQNADKSWTVTITDAEGNEQTIKVPSASSTIADIDFMGVTTLSKLDANLAENDIKDELSVEYAWIAKIIKKYDGDKETTWSAQKEVKKGQVLTTLAPNKQTLIARIESGADASELAFTLKNSKGNQLPVSVGTAAQYKGLLSRGTAGLYALSLDNTDAVYAKAADYTGLYKGGLNALVEVGGFTSNYNLTVNPVAATVAEGKVAKVGGNAIEGTYYEVDLNKDLALGFDANSKYVYDYYVEAADETIAGMFGFTADKANGTFKVTKLADAISIATFKLNVYKLHINGAIYKEQITIKPLRTIGQEVVYNLGNQTIKNSMKLTVDLADMFAALGEDAAIWKNSQLGAETATPSIKIGNDAATLANAVYTYKNANGQSVGQYYLHNATKLEITFDAVSNNAKALNVGKEYTITIVYKDVDGDKLNDIKVKFTPVMPALSSYITKREAVWNENTLMAYFAEPATPWAETALDPKYDMTTGFTKLGSTKAEDNTVITLSLDGDQKISDKKVVADGMATMTGTSLQLYKTTIGSTTKFWAYAQELNVKVAATYLGVYSFTDEEIKAAGFKVKVQSALEAGKIVPAEGSVITIPAAAAGEYAKLTADMITGYTYNNQPYSLFKNATATSTGYKYTYIKDVKFESVDNVLYTIVDTDSDTTDGVTETVWDAANKKEVVGYVQINSGQLTNTTTTEIKVTVSDRFGFSKEVKVPVKITVGE